MLTTLRLPEYVYVTPAGDEPVVVSSDFFVRHRCWIPVAPLGMRDAREGQLELPPGTVAQIPFEWWNDEIGYYYQRSLREVPEAEFLALASTNTVENRNAVQKPETEAVDVGEQAGDGAGVGGEDPQSAASSRKRTKKA